MTDLRVSHDERLKGYFNALNPKRQEPEESRKDFEFKLSVLIDAQIRNQDEISTLKEISKSILKRVVNLENQ
jgi:hypothetical protein